MATRPFGRFVGESPGVALAACGRLDARHGDRHHGRVRGRHVHLGAVPVLALVSALFPIPKIALVPLFIIWFGIGEGSKFATLAIGVFFPTVISTYSGIDNVQRNLITMGQSFNLSTWSIVRKIMLPGALPSVLAGFRITISVAIILLVAAEMIGADSGIGAFILSAGNLYRTDDLIAGVVILSLIGLVLSAILTRVERAAFTWR